MAANAGNPRSRARRAALQALYQWQMTGQDTGDIIAQFLEEQDFAQVDSDFFRDLVTGVARDHEDIDTRLEPFLDRPTAQVEIIEQVVLRLGAW